MRRPPNLLSSNASKWIWPPTKCKFTIILRELIGAWFKWRLWDLTRQTCWWTVCNWTSLLDTSRRSPKCRQPRTSNSKKKMGKWTHNLSISGFGGGDVTVHVVFVGCVFLVTLSSHSPNLLLFGMSKQLICRVIARLSLVSLPSTPPTIHHTSIYWQISDSTS